MKNSILVRQKKNKKKKRKTKYDHLRECQAPDKPNIAAEEVVLPWCIKYITIVFGLISAASQSSKLGLG